jgi:hypothetical protein
VHDGNWHVDLYLGTGVTYRDAEAIILALRRGELIDRRVPQDRQSGVLRLDPGDITSIERPHRTAWAPPLDPREYEIKTGDGGGNWLSVRIVDSGVEVHKYGQWIT